MYRVTLSGVVVECDKHDELLVLLNGSRQPSPAVRTVKRGRPRKAAATPTGNSWTIAKAEAAKQGRTDIAKVRSEIAEAKIKAARAG